MTDLWIGTYPPAGLGTPVGMGEGLWRARLASDGSLDAEQVTVQDAPSFVTAHPTVDVIYAVSESDPSALLVHDAGTGERLARVELGGAFACHALVPEAASAVYVSNYGSGEIAVVRIGADGLPLSTTADQLLAHQGTGPRADRQEGPHAHHASISPDGTHLLVADLGTDELRAYPIGPDGLLGQAHIAASLPPGAGPRHVAAKGDHLYVVCELDHQVRTLRWERPSATAVLIDEQATTLVPDRGGDDVFDAHVEVVDTDGAPVLLASVRGANVISVFDIAPEGELTYRGAIDAGNWPRHFAVVGDRLVIACERGREVRSLALADVLGLPPEMERGAVAQLAHASAPVTSPACIAVPARR